MQMQDMRWRLLVFNDPSDIGTDLLLYKDRSYLLLPSPGEENRFVIKADSDDIDFYAGSTSLKNLDMMSSFFQKMYNSRSDDHSGPDGEYMENLVIANSRSNRRFQMFYHPAFVRNIMQIPHHLNDVALSYEVVIRSSISPLGRKRYSFYINLGMSAEDNVRDEVLYSVRENIRNVREEAKWKMILRKGRDFSFRFDLLKKPFALSTFVNVPTDEQNSEN